MATWEIDLGKIYADERVRHDLMRRCGSERSRSVPVSRDRPCRWQPGTVRNPKTNMAFRPHEAWEFCLAMLREEIPIEIMTLRIPAGKTGYVITPPGFGGELLYAKFELGSSLVFGRSFHVSDHQPKKRND